MSNPSKGSRSPTRGVDKDGLFFVCSPESPRPECPCLRGGVEIRDTGGFLDPLETVGDGESGSPQE